jgi:hypothetical protein
MATFTKKYFALTTAILKNDLKKARSGQRAENKRLDFDNNGVLGSLGYVIEPATEEKGMTLTIYYGAEPQEVRLFNRPITFGIRTDFVCGCGRHCNALYLNPKGDTFYCRKCQKLNYKSTKINVRGEFGVILRARSQRERLAKMKEDIKQFYHNGQPTKDYKRYLKYAEKLDATGKEIREYRQTMEDMQKMRAEIFKGFMNFQ